MNQSSAFSDFKPKLFRSTDRPGKGVIEGNQLIDDSSDYTLMEAENDFPVGDIFSYTSLKGKKSQVSILGYKTYFDEKKGEDISYALLKSGNTKFAVEVKNLKGRLESHIKKYEFEKVSDTSNEEIEKETIPKIVSQVSNVIEGNFQKKSKFELFLEKQETKSEAQLYKEISLLNNEIFIKICSRYSKLTEKIQKIISKKILNDFILLKYNGSSKIYNFLNYKLKNNLLLKEEEINYLFEINQKNFKERNTDGLQNDGVTISNNGKQMSQTKKAA